MKLVLRFFIFLENILNYIFSFKYFKQFKKYKRFFKYSIVGASAALIQITVLLVLVKIFFLQKDIAYIIGVEFAVLWAFYFHSNFTFKDRKEFENKKIIVQLFKFHIVNITTILGQILLFKFLTDKIFVEHNIFYLTLSSIISILTMFILNFILHYFFTFKKKK